MRFEPGDKVRLIEPHPVHTQGLEMGKLYIVDHMSFNGIDVHIVGYTRGPDSKRFKRAVITNEERMKQRREEIAAIN